jgi:hypothetical protein
MFEKMFTDQPDQWQRIEETQVRQELGNYYRNVEEVIDWIRRGGKARTPFAFYKLTLKSCNDRAYVDYFRRGLITANEWARLET